MRLMATKPVMTTTASLTEQIAVIDKAVVLDHLTDMLHEAREINAAAREYAHLLALLVDARAALDPQHHDLAGRIDDALRPQLQRVTSDLVWERLPSGEFAWLKAS